MKKITEQASTHRNLETLSIRELLVKINREDQTVPLAVEKAIPAIEPLVGKIVEKMEQGGRLFYIGAGTSGRLGIVDASECPPTYGVPHDWVIGIIAGGDSAIRKAVEFAEDQHELAWQDLQNHQISPRDVVIGISASGSTPYVVYGLEYCRKNGVTTGCITCNPDSRLEEQADFPVVIITGPEFVTGSTRMKAGTAQKLALNMISTSVMIRLGRVLDNKMVDMQLTNNKLVERGIRMLQASLNISEEEALEKLMELGSVRAVLQKYDI
jgi:N-acetylmuramic acid 6-phosphate etherase